MDASAAVLGLLNDGAARRHLAQETSVAPHLVDSEVAHALRSHVLRGTLSADHGSFALSTWARLGVRRYEVVGLLERVWELRAHLSGYDATYVALAEALDCLLLTADARLGSAPGPRCPVTVIRD